MEFEKKNVAGELESGMNQESESEFGTTSKNDFETETEKEVEKDGKIKAVLKKILANTLILTFRLR